jgi:diaminopimelate epimerase
MMDFAKYHALGNDYIIIDPHCLELMPTPETILLLCNRHFGIGADGVLLGPIGLVSEAEPVQLRIFNSDGSECEKSGNGLRIFALYLAEHYLTGDRFVIHTLAGDSPVCVRDIGTGIVQVGMGRPRFDTVAQPLEVNGRELNLTSVDMGNPHAVIPMARISPELAHELGPAIGRNVRFPNGTNVQLMRVLDRHAIEIEIWERGAGYTLASGSSSCAAAAAAHTLGLVDNTVDVRMPGGTIQIEIGSGGEITMTGTAQPVVSGRLAAAFRAHLCSFAR